MSNEQAIKWSELTHYNDKQKEADAALKDSKYILYGGAMGGGKSYWIRWSLVKLLLQFYAQTGKPGIRVGLFCEDYPALRDRHVSKMNYELPQWLGTMHKGDNEYILAPQYGSGVIALRNLDDPSKYASSEFAAIAVDELTKNPKTTFEDLRTRMRWPGINKPKFIAGTNPGSIGHQWVKDIWMDGKFEPGERESDLFAYIKATAYDNTANLPDTYFLQLEGLPEQKKKAFLEGDWDLFEGQYFSEWRHDLHVVEPFKLPDTWRRFGGYDHGRANPACFKWYAVDWDGNVWVYRELYINKADGSPRWEADKIAQEVAKITKDANEYLEYVVADSAIFSNHGHGETIADVLKKNGIGKSGTCIPVMLPSHKDRVAGWTLMHQHLYHDKHTQPKLRYFKTCADSIRTIPALIYDERKLEDLNSDGEDHAADVDRYFLQTMYEKRADRPKTYEERKMDQYQEKMGLKPSNFIDLERFNNL